jgi:hypothetical protein
MAGILKSSKTLFTLDLKGRVLPLLEELERLLGSRKEAVEVAAKAGALLGASAQLLRSNFQGVLAEGLSEEQPRTLLRKAPDLFKYDWSDRIMPTKLEYYERELGVPRLELLLDHGGYLNAGLAKVDRMVSVCQHQGRWGL